MDEIKVKCGYKNCVCGNFEMSISLAKKDGKYYYHPECYKTKMEIKEVIDLFKKHINPNPIYAQLNSVINNIVFNKCMGSEFLLYGLKYYIEHKLPLRYPQGLYYVVQNEKVIESYKKKMRKRENKTVEIITEDENSFTYIPTKVKGFGDILK